MTILGISLGTRSTGVAVLNEYELLHWQRHGFPGKWSEEKVAIILRKLEWHVRLHCVDHAIIKMPSPSHQTVELLYLRDRVIALLQFHNCTVKVTTKTELKKVIPAASNQAKLMQYVVERYPILLPEKKQEEQNTNPVHIKMFEAVFAAIIALETAKN